MNECNKGYLAATPQGAYDPRGDSDDELMAGVVNRQADALECIYKRYKPLLHSVILRVISEESDVDDVLHDVLLQLWEHGRRYRPNENGLRGYLITLARRRALDRLRSRAAYRRATEGLKIDLDNPLTYEGAPSTSQIEINDLSELLSRVIQDLPAAQRQVINLTFFKGMSQREIAAKAQISLGTVKTRLQLARRKLHNFLEPLQSEI
jgi:RNA polymerase sigma-70 factor (ECF subfamily)